MANKSPLRGNEVGVIHYYWFLEGTENELLKEKVMVDADCCLPLQVFKNLSIEALLNDACCAYPSAEAALVDLQRAYQRISNQLENR